MFGRVTRIEIPLDKIDHALHFADQTTRPAVLALGGLGLTLLIDRASGASLALTWWKDEVAARSSTEAANKIREEFRQEANGKVLNVRIYDVSVDLDMPGIESRAARVTPAKLDSKRIAEFKTWTETQLIPTYRAQPGFGAWRTLVDNTTGECLIVSFWENDAKMKAAETLLAQSRGRGTQELGVQFEPTERYEVGQALVPHTAPSQQQPHTGAH